MIWGFMGRRPLPDMNYGMDPFFLIWLSRIYELLLGQSHFAYVSPLSNHSYSTAKLGKKDPPRITLAINNINEYFSHG